VPEELVYSRTTLACNANKLEVRQSRMANLVDHSKWGQFVKRPINLADGTGERLLKARL
jgi:hypothetical protein